MALRDLGNGYYTGESAATIEVYRVTDGDLVEDGSGEPLEPGWYWWACFPGCLPDGDANGPFATKQEALNDAEAE